MMPELAFAEHRTTQFITNTLGSDGIELLPCPTDTGAFAVVRGSSSNHSILIRADIDAITVAGAPDPLVPTVMHACGHDAHTAILLAVAAELANGASLPADVLLVFQPGEEFGGGARLMIERGLLDPELLARARCGIPRAVTGLHVTSRAPAGWVGIADGLALSGADCFSITVRSSGAVPGVGGTGELVSAVALLADRLPRVVTSEDAGSPSPTVSIGTVSAGASCNAVAEAGRIDGVLRAFTDRTRAVAMQRMSELVCAVSEHFGIEAPLDFGAHIPPTINNRDVTAIARKALATVVPTVSTIGPTSPSDDISEFLSRIPGCYFMFGAGYVDGADHPHHTARFDIDEDALPLAVTALCATARSLALAVDQEAT